MTTPVVREAVAVLLWRDGRVLLGRRADGSLGLPAGRMEPDEHVSGCAIRELAEETGLYGVATGTAGEVTAVIAGEHWRTCYVVAEADGDPVVLEPDKIADWAFYAPDALPSPLFAPLAAYIAEHGLAAPAR